VLAASAATGEIDKIAPASKTRKPAAADFSSILIATQGIANAPELQGL
jgi:hypothetical protein